MSTNKSAKRAIQLLAEGAFPADWALVPVAGKETYVKGWTKRALDRTALELEYKLNGSYRGLGVVTGGFSNGLIALDIDGPTADARYRDLAGDDYMAFGKEDTWTTTSGREGRRQIFWRVPTEFIDGMEDVSAIIRRVDGRWHLGKGDPQCQADKDELNENAEYEELVLRFNKCQSVLPGSPHPITKGVYWWANDVREVKPAPPWVIDAVLPCLKSKDWMSSEMLDEIREDMNTTAGDTLRPINQIRGWFFKTDKNYPNQKILAGGQELLEKLVFKAERFQKGFRWSNKGGNQRANFCPWHGGRTGTSFQYCIDNGWWYCHAERRGGDIVDFVHRIYVDDIYVDRPRGADLERVVRELAAAVDLDYDIEIQKVRVETKEDRALKITPEKLLDQAEQIMKTERNPGYRNIQLQNLINSSNFYGYKPKQLMSLVRQSQRYKKNGGSGILRKRGWSKEVSNVEAVIPGLMQTCRQYMVHARGGVGKSAMAMCIARMIGLGEEMMVRGIKVQAQQGPVMWVSNDQGTGQLKQMMLEQNLEEELCPWFHMVDNWMSDQHDDLVEIIQEVKPRLIVMDSLSTVIEGDENRGEYADYIYQMSKCNGDPGVHGGFEGCALLWIHHNRKDDSVFRGSDRLQNAVDEAWALRTMTEEEEEEHGHDKRFLTIGKSRMGRHGDRLMVSMDDEYNLTVEDMTPTLQRKGIQRNGNFTADGLVLDILANAENPLGRVELLDALNIRMRNQAGKEITEWGLRKFIARWLEQQLIEEGKWQPPGGGRPRRVYSSRGVRDSSLSNIDVDDPLTWPPLAFELFKGAHKNWVKNSPEPIPSNTLTEFDEGTPGCTHPGEPLSVGDQNESVFVNSPDSEKVTPATDPEESSIFGEISPSLRGENAQSEIRESDRWTYDRYKAIDDPNPAKFGAEWDPSAFDFLDDL